MRRSFGFWILLAATALPLSFNTAVAQKESKLDIERGYEEGHQQEMIDWYSRFVNPLGDPNYMEAQSKAFQEWRQMENIPTIATTSSSAWTQLGTSLNNGTNSGRATSLAFHPSDPNTMYLATSMGGVWKTTDAGKNWVSMSDTWQTLNMGAVAIDPQNPNVVYAATGDNWGQAGVGVYKTTDAGANWTLISAKTNSEGYQMKVSPDSSDLVYLTNNNGVQLSSDGGVTWKGVVSISPEASLVIDPSNPSVLYAAGGGTVRKSIDRGRTWRVVYTGPGADLMTVGISPKDPLKVYCAVSVSNATGSIIRSTDSGHTWTVMSSGLTYLNSGGNSQGWYANALAVNPANADDIVIGGLDIYRSTNGGKSISKKTEWTANSRTSNFTHADIHHLLYSTVGGSTTLYTLSDGGIYYSKTLGESWAQDMNKNLGTFQFVGGDVSPDFKLGYAGAQDNGVSRITIGNPFWSDIHGGDGGLTTVSQTDGQTVYSEYLGVVLYRSDNGGNNWAVGNNGTDDILAGTEVKKEPVGGYMTYDVCESAPLTIGVCGSSHLFLATDGTNFSNVTGSGSGFTGSVKSVHIAKADPSYIYAASPGAVNVSTDQGTSWTHSKVAIGGVLSLTTDVNDPTHVYAAASGSSHFYFSTDTGRTWTKPTTNLPGGVYKNIAVAADGQLFISNDFGVLRSQDGGKTWWPMKEGLPTAQVTSLRVRADKYLIATTYGRGMYYIDLSQLPPVPTSGVAPSTQSASNPASQPSITGLYPNPALTSNAHGTVNFRLPVEGRVTLSVYDALGREERVIANEWQSAGDHQQEMDLTNLTAGRHYIVLTANGKTITRALTIE